MNNNSKKKKKSTKHQDDYNTEQLAKLGIFKNENEDIIDEEDREFWRAYI